MTTEEITRELTFMRDAGIGGVELQPVYPVEVDDPGRDIRNIRYFSKEWFDLLRHTVGETLRLGLQFDLTLGSGWPYGGPFIPLELAARRLNVISQEVEGPCHFSLEFLAGEIAEGQRVFLALSVPVLPSGAPDIERSRVMAQDEQAEGRAFRPDGWDIPSGRWRLMLFMDSPTRQQVKRPTIGMEGYVLDHFNRQALELFLRSVGNRTLDELASFSAPPIHSVFCDSLEVYGADWTSDLMHEFERRRGYALGPYLPALWHEAGPLTPHVRYDYHLTLSELTIENFFQPLAQWGGAHGVTTRTQAHGAMGDVLRAYGMADIPEGESIHGGDRYLVDLKHRRLASSAGHIFSKPVISGETYTWLRQPLFLVTLEMMKAATDAMFLDGINQIVNHGYPSSPPAAGLPGWTFYASTVINHNNTWWRHYPHLAAYIRRTSALLRQGMPVNPVAVYLPLPDLYTKFGCGGLNVDELLETQMGLELFLDLRRAGYDFDAINDYVLTEVARVSGARLSAGTAEYEVVIVPACKFMPPESLARLAEFVECGGSLIFIDRVPEIAPGIAHQAERTARLKELLSGLWETQPPPKDVVHNSGRGRALVASSLQQALDKLSTFLTPDFTILTAGENSQSDLNAARENVGFVHRRLGPVDFYFVSNVSSAWHSLRLRFSCGYKYPQRWNLETGVIEEALAFDHVKTGDSETTEVDVHLEPFESCFLVFGSGGESPMITRTDWPGPLQIKYIGKSIKVTGLVSENRDYFLVGPNRRTHRFAVRDLPGVVIIPGPWKLILGDSKPIDLPQLQSWADLPGGKGYSGWATYETTFEMKDRFDEIEWVIDLGLVHETAEVELNGASLGAAWKGARRLSTKTVRWQNQNHLKIKVANLWIDWVVNNPPRNLRLVSETFGARWGKPEVAVPQTLPPSGLLGPVRLVPFRNFTVTL